jgi:microcompartment protein CcmL/EutN
MDVTVLGVLELSSIAAGIETMDTMVKAAPIRIVEAKAVCPGKFLITVTGDVASVDAALEAGKRKAEGYIVDELFIPNLHKGVVPAIKNEVTCTIWDAIGVIEYFSVVASIEAGDIAAKTAGVLLTEIRLATGLAGKSYVKMVGDIHDVEAAMKRGSDYVRAKGLLCKDVIVAQPHSDIRPFFL